jgi:hypothetical protein
MRAKLSHPQQVTSILVGLKPVPIMGLFSTILFSLSVNFDDDISTEVFHVYQGKYLDKYPNHPILKSVCTVVTVTTTKNCNNVNNNTTQQSTKPRISNSRMIGNQKLLIKATTIFLFHNDKD